MKKKGKALYFGRVFAQTAALLVAMFLLPAANPAFAELPKLSLPDAVFDFGTVPEGTVVEHRFRVTNQGTGPLKIRKIHPSCGCTAAILDTDTLPPGGGTFITTSFDTSGFRGHKVKTIRLYTNDPEQTSALLTLRGTVQPDVEVDPPRLHFGDLLQGQSSSITATVTVAAAGKIEIQDITSRASELEVVSEDFSEGEKKGKKFTVTVLPNVPVGVFRDRIVIKTTSKKNPVINVPVFAYVEGDWNLEPKAASFGLVKGPLKEPIETTVILSYRGAEKGVVTGVNSDNSSVAVEYSPLEEPGKYAIKVKVSDDAEGVVRGRIRITTDHKDFEQRELLLPVYAIINRAP